MKGGHLIPALMALDIQLETDQTLTINQTTVDKVDEMNVLPHVKETVVVVKMGHVQSTKN